MNGDAMTVSEISAFRGMTAGAARSWVAEQVRIGRLEACGRDLSTGAKLYPREQVLAAIEAMPGQGSRTDLRSRDHDHPNDRPPA